MLPFALPMQSDDAPETSLRRPQWANQGAHHGLPVCLEATHRLLIRARRRTAPGRIGLEAIRRRGAAPAGRRVGKARAAAVIVEGGVLPVVSHRR